MSRLSHSSVRVLFALAVLGLPGLSPAHKALQQDLADAPAGAYAAASDSRSAIAPSADLETNLCTEQLLMSDPKSHPGWNGWGNGAGNLRFQPKSQAKLTATDLPHLELKWAFGYANVLNAQSQPTVLGGRVFAPSENGHVYALNARTGCRYWTYTARAGIRTAIVTGSYHDSAGNTGVALFFGDRQANAYAVDAQTGRQIWVRKVDTHPAAAIAGALAFDGTRVLVAVEGSAEERMRASAGYPCCTFRGSVSALDANSGTVIWKTYTVDDSTPHMPGQDGTQSFGPAGGGIAATPTIDDKRRLVYVATGNSYADPAQLTTDAVLALDIDTGEIKWSQQMIQGDTPGDAQVDYGLSAPPALVHAGDRDLLVLPQKSGLLWALDPDKSGATAWQFWLGQGSRLGGQWGVALDSEHLYVGIAGLQTATPGGMRAMSVADGKPLWDKPAPAKLCGTSQGCSAGQGGPLTAIPGAVLNGSLDGGLRAYSAETGAILWTFDTNRDFDTVNGVKAHGGSMDSAGPIVVDGMVYVVSGSGGPEGRPGNVLLALGLPDDRKTASVKARSVNCSPFCKD